MTLTIVQISDTHLSAASGEPEANFARVVDWINESRPDLVVHTGDIVLADPDDDDDRAAARDAMSAIEVPWVAIPGNHDVGDTTSMPWGNVSVTAERVATFREWWGDDRFALDLDGWRLVGVNALTIDEGDPDEQLAWLDGALVGRCALFTHLPIDLGDSPDNGPGYTMTGAAADRMRKLAARASFVASGHLHRWARHVPAAVWCPSTAFVGSDWDDTSDPAPGIVVHRCSTTVISNVVRP
jgi:hypothetical protein